MVDHIEKPEREQDRNILNGQWGKVEKVKGGRWEQGNYHQGGGAAAGSVKLDSGNRGHVIIESLS